MPNLRPADVHETARELMVRNALLAYFVAKAGGRVEITPLDIDEVHASMGGKRYFDVIVDKLVSGTFVIRLESSDTPKQLDTVFMVEGDK